MVDLVLYGHPDSGHACKVALALSLAGLPYRAVWIDIWADPASRPADFRRLIPTAHSTDLRPHSTDLRPRA
ncbi:MAG: glutathione S-transferase N-terminal domain-containing protein [Rhodobacter sp.]|nr:glutathione S-transferase N-terminal domain-containing protein [Rhodobacter sp.]